MKRINYDKFLLYIDKDLKIELEQEASSLGMSLSAYIRQLLRKRKENVFYDQNIKN